MVKIPEYCDLFTVEEFAYNVKLGAFIPSDGIGYWATETHEDDETNVFYDSKPEWATHVAWYNK